MQSALTDTDGADGLAIGTVASIEFIANHDVESAKLVELLAGPAEVLADLNRHQNESDIFRRLNVIANRYKGEAVTVLRLTNP